MLLEDLAHDERHTPHVVPGDTGTGIEIDADLVGVLEGVSRPGMRVQVDTSEIHDPQELGRVAHHDLPRGSTRRKGELDSLDPLGSMLGSALLEEGLALGTVHVTLEHDWSSGDAAQRPLG